MDGLTHVSYWTLILREALIDGLSSLLCGVPWTGAYSVIISSMYIGYVHNNCYCEKGPKRCQYLILLLTVMSEGFLTNNLYMYLYI